MAQLTADNIVDMLIALLPKGDAWPTTRNSWWGELFYGFASEIAATTVINESLLKEMSTHTVEQMLEEYEVDYGLPNCNVAGQTFAQRKAALMIKDDLVGRQDKQFFIALAAQLGYTITITEYSASNPGPATSFNGSALAGDDWNYVWEITADTNVVPRTYGSQYGEPYENTNSELIECTLRRYVHSHRVLLFNFL